MLAASQIPVDERLPQLAQVAGEESMAALFAPYLDMGWSLRRCTIKEARYYPGFTCLLAYHLKCENISGELVSVQLHGRAFGPEAVPAVFTSRPGVATVAGTLPSWLPEGRLALWSFPEDPGMPGLTEIWQSAGTVFDSTLIENNPWSGPRPPLDIALVSYVPTKRCILRYDDQDDSGSPPFYGKVYALDSAEEIYRAQQALWEYSRRFAPELQLAQPLGYDARLNAVWQASPGGEPLLELLDAVTLPTILKRVAAALAALHRSDVRPARVLRLHEETAKLERARTALVRFYPMLEHDIDRVLGRLMADAPPEAERLVPVHGDFHCNQVLVRDERVAIIDFDLAGVGDPLHDVGRFLSRFRAYAQGKITDAAAKRAQESFLSTYEILVPWRVDRERLAWTMATLLVNRQALKSVKKLSAGGPEPVAALLETAAAIAKGRGLR